MYSKLIVTKHKLQFSNGYTLHEMFEDLNNVPPSAIVEEFAASDGTLWITFSTQEEVEVNSAGNQSTK